MTNTEWEKDHTSKTNVQDRTGGLDWSIHPGNGIRVLTPKIRWGSSRDQSEHGSPGKSLLHGSTAVPVERTGKTRRGLREKMPSEPVAAAGAREEGNEKEGKFFARRQVTACIHRSARIHGPGFRSGFQENHGVSYPFPCGSLPFSFVERIISAHRIYFDRLLICFTILLDAGYGV